jgi:hypothetical protein
VFSISSIISEDLELIESSSLVREADEIFNNYIFPLFKAWILKRGKLDVPGYKESIEFDPSAWRSSKNHVYDIAFKVPSYWKIPALRGKMLMLSVTLEHAQQCSFLIGGSMRHDKEIPSLKLQIYCHNFSTTILQQARLKIRSVIAHELEHYLDLNTDTDNPANTNKDPYISPSGKATLKTIASYYLQPIELRAKVKEIIEYSKQSRIPIQRVFNGHMQEILGHLYTASDIGAKDSETGESSIARFNSIMKKIETTIIAAIKQRYPKVKLKTSRAK